MTTIFLAVAYLRLLLAVGKHVPLETIPRGVCRFLDEDAPVSAFLQQASTFKDVLGHPHETLAGSPQRRGGSATAAAAAAAA